MELCKVSQVIFLSFYEIKCVYTDNAYPKLFATAASRFHRRSIPCRRCRRRRGRRRVLAWQRLCGVPHTHAGVVVAGRRRRRQTAKRRPPTVERAHRVALGQSGRIRIQIGVAEEAQVFRRNLRRCQVLLGHAAVRAIVAMCLLLLGSGRRIAVQSDGP